MIDQSERDAIASTLTQFTGVRTATLESRLKKLETTLERIDNGEADGGGGSPREGMLDQIEEIEAELHRREVEIS